MSPKRSPSPLAVCPVFPAGKFDAGTPRVSGPLRGEVDEP